MFKSRKEQLSDLELAYEAFIQTAKGLSPTDLMESLGDWTPRDILAHFIGWNRITLAGCAELREGIEPFYFYDGTNDYRKVNAPFFERFNSTDCDILLTQIKATMGALAAYLWTVGENEWELDTGIVHYRGGPATVARCVDSLIRDYRKHREEIISGLQVEVTD